MVGSLSATALNLVLNYIFINKYGYIAAGYTTIFCYMIQATIDYFGMKKVVGENVYNIKYILCLSVAVVIFALTSNFIYDYALIRYTIILISLVIIYIFRKKIINTFLTIKNKNE